jgi:hypothetical protein
MSGKENERVCLVCERLIKGRIDKKFCNDYCRNAYNNNCRSGTDPVVRRINSILAKNRRILMDLLHDKQTVRVAKERLLECGFRFQHFTHQYQNNRGFRYYYTIAMMPATCR